MAACCSCAVLHAFTSLADLTRALELLETIAAQLIELKKIRDENPAEKSLIFTQFNDTMSYLMKRLGEVTCFVLLRDHD